LTGGAPAAEAEGREPDAGGTGGSRDRTGFVGRGGWHLVAFVAALALVLAMSIDWYTTEQGEEFRRVEETNKNSQSSQRLDSEDIERAAQAAEKEEKNAWQASAFVDRLILIACLIAFAGAVVATFMRSAGRRPEPPWNPSAIATVAGVAGTVLILYRMLQPPGLNDAAVLEPGAPAGLASLGILTVASRLATLAEREERAEGVGPAVVEPEPEPSAEPELELADPAFDPEPVAEEPLAQEPPEEDEREERRLAREQARAERAGLFPESGTEEREDEAVEFEFEPAPPPDEALREEPEAAVEPDEPERGALEIHGLEEHGSIVEGEYVPPDEPEDHEPWEPHILEAEVVEHDDEPELAEPEEPGAPPDPGARIDEPDERRET
jgi:hypothetical protein